MDELKADLDGELERWVQELTVTIPSLLGKDQSAGHYAEIASYGDDVKRRIRHLRRLIVELPRIPPDLLFDDRIGFGSLVQLEDLDTGEQIAHTLMLGDGLLLEAGEIALASPLGQALLRRHIGDEVEVETSGRRRRFRVLKAKTLFERFPSDEGPLAYAGTVRPTIEPAPLGQPARSTTASLPQVG